MGDVLTLGDDAVRRIGVRLFVVRTKLDGSTETARALRPTGLVLRELAGMSYNPLSDAWRSGNDLGVNYIAFATR